MATHERHRLFLRLSPTQRTGLSPAQVSGRAVGRARERLTRGAFFTAVSCRANCWCMLMLNTGLLKLHTTGGTAREPADRRQTAGHAQWHAAGCSGSGRGTPSELLNSEPLNVGVHQCTGGSVRLAGKFLHLRQFSRVESAAALYAMCLRRPV